jgi:hypothetical protein
MIEESYSKLSDLDKEQLSNIINTLLIKTYILQRKYSSKDGKTRYNKDYGFVEDNLTLIKNYFNIMGCELVLDEIHGVVFLKSGNQLARVRLTKVTTILLTVLRIIYQDEIENASTYKDVIITLNKMLEKISIFRLLEKVNKTELEDALRELRKYQIIEKVKGQYDNPESLILIYPTIIHCINSENARQIISQFNDIESDIYDNSEVEDNVAVSNEAP